MTRPEGLVRFGCAVSGSLSVLFGHESPLLGRAIPLAAFVIDARVRVDPDLSISFRGRDFRIGYAFRGCGRSLLQRIGGRFCRFRIFGL